MPLTQTPNTSSTLEEKTTLASLVRKVGMWRSIYPSFKLLGAGMVGKQVGVLMQELLPFDELQTNVIINPKFLLSTSASVLAGTLTFLILTIIITTCESYIMQKNLKDMIPNWALLDPDELEQYAVRNQAQIFSLSLKLAMISAISTPVFMTGMLYATMAVQSVTDMRSRAGIMLGTDAALGIFMAGLFKVLTKLFHLAISAKRLTQLFLMMMGMIIGENITSNTNTQPYRRIEVLEYGALLPILLAATFALAVPAAELVLHRIKQRQENLKIVDEESRLLPGMEPY